MPTPKITLTEDEHYELSRRVRSPNVNKRDKKRARVILLAAQGCTRAEIALLTNFSLPVVTRWCQRFLAFRLDGLIDKPGRGRKPILSPESIKQIVEEVTDPVKKNHDWSYRSLAKKTGISASSMHRILTRHSNLNSLKIDEKNPNRSLLANKKKRGVKSWDVVGWLLTHQEKIIVLCCDKNGTPKPSKYYLSESCSLIEAKQLHQSARAMELTRVLSTLQGRVIPSSNWNYLDQDTLNFLKKIEQEISKKYNLIIIRNTEAGILTQSNLVNWIENHERFTFYPTNQLNSWPKTIANMIDYLDKENPNQNNFKYLQDFINSAKKFLTLRKIRPSLYVWHANKNER